jgi:mannose-1-phosphate guanylyltransferase
MHAVILAGGKGTRLRPLTDTRPKPLVPFLGDPFAFGLLRRLAGVGTTRATFLVGQDAAPFAPLVEAGPQLGLDIAVATEEVPLDTAGAARRLLAEPHDGPVLVCNGDILTDLDYAELLAEHEAAGAAATIALTRVEDTSAFGVVVTDDARRVQHFVEKPAPGTLPDDTVNAGTYVLSPDAFAAFPGDGPLSFERAVFPGLVEGGAVVLGVVSDAHWEDLGTPQRYLSGTRAVLDGRCAWPGAPGLRRRGDALVDESADVADDAVLGAGVVVGAGCRIGPGASLRDAVLHDGVVVGAGAVVEGAILGQGVVVGERAHLAPTTVLGDGAVVEAGAALTGS